MNRALRHLRISFGSTRIASSAYQKWPTSSDAFSQKNKKLTKKAFRSLPIKSLRIGRGIMFPEASNHSLDTVKLQNLTAAILGETSEGTSY